MKYLSRWLSVLLILALLPIFPAGAETVNKAVLQKAIQVIGKMETNNSYTSVANDSNSCPSVGILQWNNGRAVSLLKTIIAADEETAKGALGDKLFRTLKDGSTSVWKGVKLTKEQRGYVSRLLNTDAGRAAQDALAEKDVSRYLTTAMGLGIRDAGALIYYADIAHQAGTGAVKKYAVKAAEFAGGYGNVTLEEMYRAALVYATYTKTRRTKVYNLLKSEPAPIPSVKPTGISLDKKGTVTLYVGNTLTLTATLAPENAASALQWKSSRPSVASVADGIVTAKKKGKAIIAVSTENGKKATLRIVVKNMPVSSVEITGTSVMRRGEKQKLVATILPENAYNKTLRWKSSNKKVVAVNQKGYILAKKKGTATIACQTRDGTKIVAKFKVTVK
ncbi:MAG: Ig-like domain-containing protein [Christensenellales bacterium]